MPERLGLFVPSEHPVLSLKVQAESTAAPRLQNQFEILLRHLLNRFFHNELLTSDDDETKRVLLIGYAVALPGLIVALFLFPAYHAFPPNPYPRPFWPQVSDHYFYAMYSFVVMGAITVYEWDLVFPDLLDVFVLSVLPITRRRLFLARVSALAIFLCVTLFGTTILGIMFLPMVAEQPNAIRHFLAHAVAVLTSGAFSAATFLSLQSVLICLCGERIFQRLKPLLQGGSIMLLLTILFLQPLLSQSLAPILTSGDRGVLYFPPFWFLGMYEFILGGQSATPVFHSLAHTGCYALLLMLACAVLTYPLAYRRKVRRLIEGGSVVKNSSRTYKPIEQLLHATFLLHPAQRAIFHFISQTILRTQRQRVMLAMYAGLSVALTVAEVTVLRFGSGHVRPALLPGGIRLAIPIMAFWTVAGLRSVLSSSIDRRGAWLFRVIIGRPKAGHIAGAKVWVTLWATIISIFTALLLRVISAGNHRSSMLAVGQLLVAIGVSVLLADIFLFFEHTIPFTHFRKSSITDLPFTVVRYFILFPIFVAVTVHFETRIDASILQLFKVAFYVLAAHLLLRKALARSIQQTTVDTPAEEADEFPQRLGLRSY